MSQEPELFAVNKGTKKHTEMQTSEGGASSIFFFVCFFFLCVRGMEEFWLKFFTKMSSK